MLLGGHESPASSPDFSDMTLGRERPCYPESVSTRPVSWGRVGSQFYLWFLLGVEWLLLKLLRLAGLRLSCPLAGDQLFWDLPVCPCWQFWGASFCSTLSGICEVKENPGEPPDCPFLGLTIPN